MLIKPAF